MRMPLVLMAVSPSAGAAGTSRRSAGRSSPPDRPASRSGGERLAAASRAGGCISARPRLVGRHAACKLLWAGVISLGRTGRL